MSRRRASPSGSDRGVTEARTAGRKAAASAAALLIAVGHNLASPDVALAQVDDARGGVLTETFDGVALLRTEEIEDLGRLGLIGAYPESRIENVYTIKSSSTLRSGDELVINHRTSYYVPAVSVRGGKISCDTATPDELRVGAVKAYRSAFGTRDANSDLVSFYPSSDSNGYQRSPGLVVKGEVVESFWNTVDDNRKSSPPCYSLLWNEATTRSKVPPLAPGTYAVGVAIPSGPLRPALDENIEQSPVELASVGYQITGELPKITVSPGGNPSATAEAGRVAKGPGRGSFLSAVWEGATTGGTIGGTVGAGAGCVVGFLAAGAGCLAVGAAAGGAGAVIGVVGGALVAGLDHVFVEAAY